MRPVRLRYNAARLLLVVFGICLYLGGRYGAGQNNRQLERRNEALSDEVQLYKASAMSVAKLRDNACGAIACSRLRRMTNERGELREPLRVAEFERKLDLSLKQTLVLNLFESVIAPDYVISFETKESDDGALLITRAEIRRLEGALGLALLQLNLRNETNSSR